MATLEELLRNSSSYKPQPTPEELSSNLESDQLTNKVFGDENALQQGSNPDRIQDFLNKYSKGAKKSSPIFDAPEITPPSNTEQTGFQLGQSKDLSENIDPATARLRNAIKNQSGTLVGEPRTPLSKFDESVQRLEPSTKMVNETPDISSKLQNLSNTKAGPTSTLSPIETAALEKAGEGGSLDSAMEKLGGLSDEALAKLGPIGQKIMQSKLLKIAGKVAAPLAIASEAKSAGQNISQSKYPEVAGNALGAASGIATLAGSPAAIPLAGAAFGVGQGMAMGRQQANTDTDENGMQPVDKSDVFGGSNQQLNASNASPLSPQELSSLQGPNSTSVPPPTSGTGPVSNPANYNPSTIQKMSEADSPSSMTPDQRGMKAAPSAPASDGSFSASVSPSEGFTDNTVAGLKAAQDKANQEKNQADLAQAAGMTMAGALGSKFHTAAPDLTEQNKMWEGRKKEADEGISQFLARGEQEKNDPTSAASAQSRDLARAMMKQAGLNINIPDNVSASDLEKRFPQLQHLATTAENVQGRKETAIEKAKDRAAMLQASSATKENAAQDKALQNTKQLIESARGNKAASQAESDIYAASKADSLAKLYGDPNKLSPQMAQLLYSEVAKIAQGGVPSQHELEGLDPGALKGKMAGVWQKLSNNPSPANAGAFIKQYQDYSHALTDDAHKFITDRYGRIIDSSKKQLGPENYKALQDLYINRFPVSKDTSQSSSTPGQTTMSQDVLDYAKAHNITPQQAAAIKASRTGQ